MHPALLKYYDDELLHLREMANEFAREFGTVARRLGIEEFECSDPYVERLLEGFAFLAARVHLKLDAEFPQFTEELLNLVYPDYLAPVPSAVIVELEPDPFAGGLAEGPRVKRGTILRSQVPTGEQTACEFSVCHDVTLYPIKLLKADYLPVLGAVAAAGVSAPPGTRSALRLRFSTTGGAKLSDIALRELDLHVRGAGGVADSLFDLLLRDPRGLVLRDPLRGCVIGQCNGPDVVEAIGFAENESMLPTSPASFEGYRLLREYFVLPERFHFVRLSGLSDMASQYDGTEFEIFVLLGSFSPALENMVDVRNVVLFAAPAINLFSRLVDRVDIDHRRREHHVIVDRSRPRDYEIYALDKVAGHMAGGAPDLKFVPMYGAARSSAEERVEYFSVKREPRRVSSAHDHYGARTSYLGSEIFLLLTDSIAPPARPGLQQLSARAMCTNRDLPLLLVPIGQAARDAAEKPGSVSDFSIESGEPVLAAYILNGPTRPRPAPVLDESSWRLINHLSLNYMSITSGREDDGALALRRLLKLYADVTDPKVGRVPDGVIDVRSRAVIRRIHTQGPIVAARGTEITLICEETAFAGNGLYTFGAVLDRFLAKHASINSFTETVICNTHGTELMRWPARTGLRPLT